MAQEISDKKKTGKKKEISESSIETVIAFLFIILVIYGIMSISVFFGILFGLPGLIIGLICCSMAGSRGRSEAIGLLAGFFLGIFALLYYLIAGDTVENRVKKEEEARRKYHQSHK